MPTEAQNAAAPASPESAPEPKRLTLDDAFPFRCDAGRNCFTTCCHDVSILLTPYDVLRMKRALGITSSEFLDRYAFTMEAEEKKSPVVFLRMQPDTLKCPFVGPQGCAIYAHRPWACRMYPLGMAEPESPDASAHRFYFVVREDLCQGHDAAETCTVRSYLESQGIEPYEQAQESFRRLMYHPGWKDPANTTSQKMAMFFMACYDLDRFRRFVFESRLLEFIDVDEARVEAIRDDDDELLEFATDWLLFTLFHERRMRLKQDAADRLGARKPEMAGAAAPE